MTNRRGYKVGTETHIRGYLGEPEELQDPTSHSPRWRSRERREDTLGEDTRSSVGPFLWATQEMIGLEKPVYIEQLPVLEGILPLLWEKLRVLPPKGVCPILNTPATGVPECLRVTQSQAP